MARRDPQLWGIDLPHENRAMVNESLDPEKGETRHPGWLNKGSPDNGPMKLRFMRR